MNPIDLKIKKLHILENYTSEIQVSAPKILTTRKKKKKNKLKKLKMIMLKYFDPINSHRFYGDFIFPDKLWKFNGDEGIYALELFREYKVLRQVHIREKGVILEFEDHDDNHLSKIGLIQERLMSLGDKGAHELSEFLHKYEDLFKKNEMKTEENTNFSAKTNHFKCIEWVDELFEKNEEDAVFVRGNRMWNGSDFRLKYLGYNFKLLQWLTKEVNFFSTTFIDDCLKVFKFKTFEDFANILKSSVFRTAQPKLIHTIVGDSRILIDVKLHFILSEKLFFHYIIYPKEQHDEKFLKKIEINEWLNGSSMKKIQEINQKDSQNYSELIKLYYSKKN